MLDRLKAVQQNALRQTEETKVVRIMKVQILTVTERLQFVAFGYGLT